MRKRPFNPMLPAVFISLVLFGCAAPGSDPLAGRTALIGAPAAEQPAVQRTIAITPDTQFVNVTSGETVRFVLGARSFAWSFQSGPTVSAFDLNLIAPPGMLTHPVKVYVAANPTYISNS
jgi:hypothetical protein